MWQELRSELHPRGLEIVTVALDTEGVEVARPFIEAAHAQHPSLIDAAHVVDELFGVVNVPNGVWIDEEGVIVRPAEPAFPGRIPAMDAISQIDESTLPPAMLANIRASKEIRSEPERYLAMILDWVERGSASRFALSPEEVVARSGSRSIDGASAAAHFELGQHFQRTGRTEAARRHWREAHRLQPDNWTYKRQAWNLVSPVVQGPTDVYDGYWAKDVEEIGAENYFPPLLP